MEICCECADDNFLRLHRLLEDWVKLLNPDLQNSLDLPVIPLPILLIIHDLQIIDLIVLSGFPQSFAINVVSTKIIFLFPD